MTALRSVFSGRGDSPAISNNCSRYAARCDVQSASVFTPAKASPLTWAVSSWKYFFSIWSAGESAPGSEAATPIDAQTNCARVITQRDIIRSGSREERGSRGRIVSRSVSTVRRPAILHVNQRISCG
jgi:hypothetical protein